jgi:formate dehydrogenase major subunit
VNPDDIVGLGLEEGQIVDIVSEWEDGSERRAPRFRVVSYDTPRGCTGAYYPETNALVPLDSKAEGSNQPAFKSVTVRLEAVVGEQPGEGRPELSQPSDASENGRGDEEKRHVEPFHLS